MPTLILVNVPCGVPIVMHLRWIALGRLGLCSTLSTRSDSVYMIAVISTFQVRPASGGPPSLSYDASCI